MKSILIFLGWGFLLGVPARDLTEEDLSKLQKEGWTIPALLETKLYKAAIDFETPSKGRKEIKDGHLSDA